MTKPRLVYVAGPYTAPTRWEQELRIRDAEYAMVDLARAGFMPVCPHTMCRFLDGVKDWQFWMDGCIELLRSVHAQDGAIFMLPDWASSKGASIEFDMARVWRMPTFMSMSALKEWASVGK